MLNRSIPPPTVLTDSIKVPHADLMYLPNGAKLLVVNEGEEDVCRVDLVFNAGSRYQQKNLQARAALTLLPEGTENHTSKQISEYFDFYGSFLNISVDKDFARITLSSLIKHLGSTLEMLSEVVKHPIYPERELQQWCKRGKQELMVELEKTSTLASQAFFRNVFGEQHPYGAFAIPDDYDNVQQQIIQDFHASFIGSNNLSIILSGKVGAAEIDLVVKHFGASKWGANPMEILNGIDKAKPGLSKTFVEKPNAVQTAIRIGRELFNRSHPDYPGMLVLNTILGGYFGSRLMRNIREEKGYTYGINSFIAPFRDSGLFMISTEVGSAYTEQTLKEIYFEVHRLTTEQVSNDELLLVKSYLIGEILRNFNGAFTIADSIISLLYYNELEYSYYDNLLNTIKTITPKKIAEIANKWFQSNVLIECIAGSVKPNKSEF
jgi:predicted Zn-dependent peptidase